MPLKNSAPTGIDRLPPYSLEAEQGILGCILLDPMAALPECIEKLKDETYLYDLRHQTIYRTMLELYEDRDPIDIITLTERLRVWGLLEQIGGMAYISALPDFVPSAVNVGYYVDIVREKAVLREVIRVCANSVSAIYDCQADADKLLDEVERDILRASENRAVEATVGMRELVGEAILLIEDYQRRGGQLTGIETGFIDLDRITSGLQPGDMVVFAARPSIGKTSIAMNIAEFVAIERNLPVGVFSLEMTARALTLRMICSRARVSLRNVQEGFLADRDLPKIVGAAGQLQKAPLYIDASSGLSILQLRAKARRMWQKYKIKLLVVDYLQLLNAIGGRRRIDNRQQEVSDISSGIKALAKELNVPVLVLSQLNRNIEHENRRPRLADLRESGAIEQDADVVGLMSKVFENDTEEENEPLSESVRINLAIAKQRNGPTGDVPLTFIKPYTRFYSAAKVSEADAPEQQQSLPGS